MDLSHPGGPPAGPFRSMSTTSNLSLNSSSTSITRVASGPLSAFNSSFNKQSSAQDHLFYQCSALKTKLSEIEGMEPFMNLAFNSAEQCAEQQALALSQQMSQESRGSDYRSSVGSTGFSIHSDTSSCSNLTAVTNNTSTNKALINNNIFTFTAGVLPANLSVDPATQLWKLFQQGAPLCLLFNHIVSDYQISIIGSDDMRICKKSVYDFLIAVKMHLNFDDDIMFTISNVFSDSTQDLLKIITVVNKLLALKSPKKLDLDPTLVNSMADITISDDRSKVFKELIETERKYVQDLELLASYRNELASAELISSEQIHVLFPNLNEIIDFQRRFLNGLECNIQVPNKYQRIGSIFIHASTGPFKAYEPWTIGQLAAIDLINKEAVNLKKSSSILDPGFELQSYIIKPIQRLCKYPLLLKELIKASPESLENPNQINSASFNELVLANTAMKEMANQVNEAQRRAENVEYLEKLIQRVGNWRGFNLKDQGELLYHGLVGVRDVENEKEYVAYLFERIVFFFVETPQPVEIKEKETKKKREILSTRKKSSSSASASTANLLETLNKAKSDKTSPLELKGRVYISEIYNISSTNSNGYTLVISWSGKKESGSFALRYRTEETRNQWENCLRNLKTNEMNTQIHKKLRDSHGSQPISEFESASYGNNSSPIQSAGNAISIGGPSYGSSAGTSNGSADSASLRSSNGSSYHRHHSSSSTFSMMRQHRGKSGGTEPSSRISSNGTAPYAGSTPVTTPTESFANDIKIKLVYKSSIIQALLTVSSNIQFAELYQRISSHVAANGSVSKDFTVSKLKYKDEDGDFVVMDSNDDWILAVDMLDELGEGEGADDGSKRDLTIWVS